MSQIEAIYRHGVFEPLTPVELPEDQRVRLRIEKMPDQALLAWLEQARALQAEIVEQHGVLPDSTPGIAADRLR